MNVFLHVFLQKRTVRNAIWIALFVGSVLNLINQGTELFKGDFANISWLKFGLTYLVPFLVSSYASSITKLKLTVHEFAQLHVLAKCLHCKQSVMELEKGQKITVCPICKDKTNWTIQKLVN